MSMAHLEVMGEFQGPGEERTATRLAAELPAGWYVIAGRKLSGESRDDLDLVVVGDRAVFVLEEKFWGPRLELHDQYWPASAATNGAIPWTGSTILPGLSPAAC